MINQKFLDNIFRLPTKLGTQKLIPLDCAIVAYSDSDTSVFWNNALVDSVLRQENINIIEETLQKLNRKPAICFENRQSLEPLEHSLKNNSYTKSFEDSWMFYDKNEIDRHGFDRVRKVTNEQELQIFQETFNACYQKDDPQNPYGDQSTYLPTIEKAWKNNSSDNTIEYFLVFKDSLPVAVSTLVNYGKIGYISNVGSLPHVRGEGFGKIATLYCVWLSQKNSHRNIALRQRKERIQMISTTESDSKLDLPQ